MQLMPDWFFGFVPPSWWPDRPREPFFWGLNIIPLAAGITQTVEQIFDKKRDVLVFGGCALVTNTTDTTVDCPNSGTFSSILVNMGCPAADEDYSAGTVVAAAGTQVAGFVPLESLFSSWQFAAKRPVYWPIPIPIKKGGSLQMDLINMNGAAAKNVRFGFWTAIIYDEREFAA